MLHLCDNFVANPLCFDKKNTPTMSSSSPRSHALSRGSACETQTDRNICKSTQPNNEIARYSSNVSSEYITYQAENSEYQTSMSQASVFQASKPPPCESQASVSQVIVSQECEPHVSKRQTPESQVYDSHTSESQTFESQTSESRKSMFPDLISKTSESQTSDHVSQILTSEIPESARVSQTLGSQACRSQGLPLQDSITHESTSQSKSVKPDTPNSTSSLRIPTVVQASVTNKESAYPLNHSQVYEASMAGQTFWMSRNISILSDRCYVECPNFRCSKWTRVENEDLKKIHGRLLQCYGCKILFLADVSNPTMQSTETHPDELFQIIPPYQTRVNAIPVNSFFHNLQTSPEYQPHSSEDTQSADEFKNHVGSLLQGKTDVRSIKRRKISDTKTQKTGTNLEKVTVVQDLLMDVALLKKLQAEVKELEANLGKVIMETECLVSKKYVKHIAPKNEAENAN
eukprot:840236_1